MGREFQRANRAEVLATPEQVWEAIATGPGVNSWYMGRTQIEAGVVQTAFEDFTLTYPVTAWEPGRRLTYGGEPDATGRFEAFEFLIEGREGAATVLRAVTSGFLPGDDWAEEFEAMGYGLDLFFATLITYLRHFAGQVAAPLTAQGHPVSDWTAAWAGLFDRLGIKDPKPGDPVTFTVDGIGRIDGTVYHVSAQTLGIRTGDAIYRFSQGYQGVFYAMHHLFADTDPTGARRAWTAWLERLPT